jgi:hypothetical protein
MAWVRWLALATAVRAVGGGGAGGCPTASHCREHDVCPAVIARAWAFHWDAAAIVEERAVCVCDTGFAAVTGCRNASRCGTHLGGVHAEIHASGSCAPVLLHRLDSLPRTVHSPGGGCQPELRHQCLEDGAVSSNSTLVALLARWAAWRGAARAGASASAPQGLLSAARAEEAARLAEGEVTEAQRLCFDLHKALDSQIACECDHCKEEPVLAQDIDLLGDGSCLYEARDCAPLDKTLTFGLVSFIAFGCCVGCCGLWCLRKTDKEKKKRGKKIASDRWKNSIMTLGAAGGSSPRADGQKSNPEKGGMLMQVIALARAQKAAEDAAAATTEQQQPPPTVGSGAETGGQESGSRSLSPAAGARNVTAAADDARAEENAGQEEDDENDEEERSPLKGKEPAANGADGAPKGSSWRLRKLMVGNRQSQQLQPQPEPEPEPGPEPEPEPEPQTRPLPLPSGGEAFAGDDAEAAAQQDELARVRRRIAELERLRSSQAAAAVRP